MLIWQIGLGQNEREDGWVTLKDSVILECGWVCAALPPQQ